MGTPARAGMAAQQRPGIERPGAGELAMIGGLLLEKLNDTVNALEPCRCTVPMRESSFMGRYSGDPYPEPGNRRLASARGFAHAVIGACANGGARPAQIPLPKSLTFILYSPNGEHGAITD
jgi:hypothetical protein